MDDLISRQATLDLEEWFGERATYDNPMPDGTHAVPVEAIKNLPSAELERREAHWINAGLDGDYAWQIDGRGNCWRLWRCSHCFTDHRKASKFCPECGFRMTEMPEAEE